MSTAPPGGPGPSIDPDDVRRAREANRDLFTTAQVRNPWIFVSTDNPLQTLAPPQIELRCGTGHGYGEDVNRTLVYYEPEMDGATRRVCR